MPYVFECEACHFKMSMSDLTFARRVEGRQVTLKCKGCNADIRIDGVALATQGHAGEVRNLAPSAKSSIPRPDPMLVPRAATAAAPSERHSAAGRPPPPPRDLRKTLLGVCPEFSPPRPAPPRRSHVSAATSVVDPLGATKLDAVPAQGMVATESPASLPQIVAPIASAPTALGVSDASPEPTQHVEPSPTPAAEEQAPEPQDDEIDTDTMIMGPGTSQRLGRATPGEQDPEAAMCPNASDALDADSAPAAFFQHELVTPPTSWTPGPALVERRRTLHWRAWTTVLLASAGVGGALLAGIRWIPAEGSGSPRAHGPSAAASPPHQTPSTRQRKPPQAQAQPTATPGPERQNATQPARPAVPPARVGSDEHPQTTAPEAPGEASGIPEGVQPNVLQHRVYLALKRAEQCHRGGRATGTAQVLLTFAPNGRVSSARLVGEPIASAPVGTCVLLHAGAVTLPPYEGEPFTYKSTITLR